MENKRNDAQNMIDQYDHQVFRVLANKKILAYILTHTYPKFIGLKTKDVVPLIGHCYILNMPLDHRPTNEATIDEEKTTEPNIVDLMTKKLPDVGIKPFNILFNVTKPDRSDDIIVSIEVRSTLTTRLFFDPAGEYTLLMEKLQEDCLSLLSQKIPMKNVASIWLLMDNEKNFIYSQRHTLNPEFRDSIISFYVAIEKKIPDCKKGNELNRLIAYLLALGFDVDEKMTVLKEEYPELVDEELRRELITLGDLGEKLSTEYKTFGYDQAMTRVIAQMHKAHEPLEKIMLYTGKSEEYIKKLIDLFTK